MSLLDSTLLLTEVITLCNRYHYLNNTVRQMIFFLFILFLTFSCFFHICIFLSILIYISSHISFAIVPSHLMAFLQDSGVYIYQEQNSLYRHTEHLEDNTSLSHDRLHPGSLAVRGEEKQLSNKQTAVLLALARTHSSHIQIHVYLYVQVYKYLSVTF